MTSSYELAASALLAEAAYANLREPSGVVVSTASALIRELVAIGWSQTQAAEFASRYRVVEHQANTDTGFSATLFERLNEEGQPTGKLVLAARGTEAIAQGGLDLAVDLGDLVADGLAWPQIVDMYNYWQRLSTLPGATYQRAMLVQAPADALDGTYILDRRTGPFPNAKLRIELTAATDGLGIVGTSAPLEVVGHSLGGHLSSALTRLFPGRASQAYSINGAGYAEVLGSQNAPGFFPHGAPILNRFRPGWDGANILCLEASGDLVSEIGTTYPGSRSAIAQENGAAISTSARARC